MHLAASDAPVAVKRRAVDRSTKLKSSVYKHALQGYTEVIPLYRNFRTQPVYLDIPTTTAILNAYLIAQHISQKSAMCSHRLNHQALSLDIRISAGRPATLSDVYRNIPGYYH
jgi:hypothetical protein